MGPDLVAAAAEGDAGEVVALSLRPLGGRFVEPLPSRVLDYAVEVPAYGDRFVAGNLREQVELLARARAMDVPAGTRLLVERDDLDLETVRRGAACAAGGGWVGGARTPCGPGEAGHAFSL